MSSAAAEPKVDLLDDGLQTLHLALPFVFGLGLLVPSAWFYAPSDPTLRAVAALAGDLLFLNLLHIPFGLMLAFGLPESKAWRAEQNRGLPGGLVTALVLVALLFGTAYALSEEAFFSPPLEVIRWSRILFAGTLSFLFAHHGVSQVRGISFLYDRALREAHPLDEAGRARAAELESEERAGYQTLILGAALGMGLKQPILLVGVEPSLLRLLQVGAVLLGLAGFAQVMRAAMQVPNVRKSHKLLFLSRLVLHVFTGFNFAAYLGRLATHGVEYVQIYRRTAKVSRWREVAGVHSGAGRVAGALHRLEAHRAHAGQRGADRDPALAQPGLGPHLRLADGGAHPRPLLPGPRAVPDAGACDAGLHAGAADAEGFGAGLSGAGPAQGSVNETRAPPPSRASAEALPPWASAIRRTSARPSPSDPATPGRILGLVVEGLEEPRGLLGGEAWARILNGEADLRAFVPDRQLQPRRPRGCARCRGGWRGRGPAGSGRPGSARSIRRAASPRPGPLAPGPPVAASWGSIVRAASAWKVSREEASRSATSASISRTSFFQLGQGREVGLAAVAGHLQEDPLVPERRADLVRDGREQLAVDPASAFSMRSAMRLMAWASTRSSPWW